MYADLRSLDEPTLLYLAQVGARYIANAPLGVPGKQIADPATAAEYFADMAQLEQEEMRVALLDNKHCVLRIITVARGNVSMVGPARIAELFRDAVRDNAAKILIAHNHPSGDPEPSPEDVGFTRKVKEAGALLGIPVLDHLVIGKGRWVSFNERRLAGF